MIQKYNAGLGTEVKTVGILYSFTVIRTGAEQQHLLRHENAGAVKKDRRHMV